MRGTYQLLVWFLLTGLSLGAAITYFKGQPVGLLIAGTLFWIGFMFHVADAAWIPSRGRGRDWIDRIGILIRGVGFGLVSVGWFIAPDALSLVLGLAGLIGMIFGRALWELAVLPQGK